MRKKHYTISEEVHTIRPDIGHAIEARAHANLWPAAIISCRHWWGFWLDDGPEDIPESKIAFLKVTELMTDEDIKKVVNDNGSYGIVWCIH